MIIKSDLLINGLKGILMDGIGKLVSADYDRIFFYLRSVRRHLESLH